MSAFFLKKIGTAAAVITVVAVSSSSAETILQTTTNPSPGVDWNQASIWGGNAVVSGNDYSTVSSGVVIGNGLGFTANGTLWVTKSSVRDSTSTSTFGGGSLILETDTRLLMKGNAANTSTANIVLNGGFIQAAPNAGGSTTLAGTINALAPLSAIGTNPFGGTTLVLNINSTIIGSGTIQLVGAGEAVNGTRISHINLNGDISAFTGTFYLTQADNIPSAVGSDFSIASGSAPLATLQLSTASTNLSFSFNLNSNVAFGTVIVDGMVLDPGTYGFAELDALAPGSFVDNGGTITVVPEPSTFALFALGMAAALGGIRHRRREARGKVLASSRSR